MPSATTATSTGLLGEAVGQPLHADIGVQAVTVDQAVGVKGQDTVRGQVDDGGLKGHMDEDIIGTPQGGILSPLLANVALSVRDEHFTLIEGGPRTSPKRRFTRRRKGLANNTLIQ
ncbi:hypothetical protein ABZ400_34600 [Streptomyces sp. NPDC005897]|uniref:hypothetical protein n=1 Tax=Streptomyces sp. NPDC005897 TaxID=3157081 RepID=UPI0033E66C06